MRAAQPTFAVLVRPHLNELGQRLLDRLNDAGLKLEEELYWIADDCDAVRTREIAIARTHLQTALMHALHALLVNNNTARGADGDA